MDKRASQERTTDKIDKTRQDQIITQLNKTGYNVTTEQQNTTEQKKTKGRKKKREREREKTKTSFKADGINRLESFSSADIISG